jgi:hypothetical protein
MSEQTEKKLRTVRFALTALPPLVWAVWLAFTASISRLAASPMDAIMGNMGSAFLIAIVVGIACAGVYYAYRAALTRSQASQ